MAEFIAFLDCHSGALTFLATTVYVIATIFICGANIKSANATKKQVAESERQFEETQRLQIMPFLQIEIKDISNFDLTLDLNVDNIGIKSMCNVCTVLRNVGLGAATNIIYSWTIRDNSVSTTDVFPINAVQQGDSYNLLLLLNGEENQELPQEATLHLEYMDMRGESYEQKFIFDFGDSCESGLISTLTIATDSPNYLGTVVYSIK